ncbi:MAG: ATP-binding protein [Bacteriovoracaceae bacterium]|nr:ATP-binding protein [Bacteriovoracaceae bacterium]
MWIKRDISHILQKNQDFIQILIGPRQCGKSSLLHNLSKDFGQNGEEFVELSMDDLNLRKLALEDPQGLLDQYDGKKLIIDEAQLAPEIFYALKRKIDLLKRAHHRREIMFRLTGSNQILMDRSVKESLAGRASYFDLNTLSVAEILAAGGNTSMAEILFKGGWPELYTDPTISTKKYLDDYIRTYVEKDIVLAAGIQKQNEFIRFAQLLAGRTGHQLNFSELSKEVGVSNETIHDWTSILERMKMIALVPPYFSNQSKRLVKAPRVYFLDTGLACRLQGHSEIAPLLSSPQLGHLFETLVFGEIYKTAKNFDRDWKIFHWRTRDGEEVDFLIQMENQKFLFLEAKVSFQMLDGNKKLVEAKKVFKDGLPPRFLCHMSGDQILGHAVPIKYLRDFLLNQ